MTTEEVNAIFSLLDINKDGKLEYAEVSSSLKWLPFLLNLFPLLYINACQFIISEPALYSFITDLRMTFYIYRECSYINSGSRVDKPNTGSI